MGLDDEDLQRLSDVATTGEAIGKLRPLFSEAPLPLPFRLPSTASWAQSDPYQASGMDDDFGEMNAGGASSFDFDDEADNEGPSEDDAPVDLAPLPVLAGISADVGTTRATCAFLIHGDPKMHRLTASVLAWTDKQNMTSNLSNKGN